MYNCTTLYEYQKLPMWVCNSPDIFQENISELFDGFYMVREYIHDVLVIDKDIYKDHIKPLYRVLQRLAESELKVNAEKSLFRQT